MMRTSAAEASSQVQRRRRWPCSQTAPLIEYYSKAGLLVPIDGLQPIESVTAEVLRAVGAADGAPA